MHDTENETAENAGDQDENVRDLVETKRPACGVLATHERHVMGSAEHPIHCAGYTSPDDLELTYVAAFQLWETANAWCAKYGTLVHHARVLARKLDRAGDEATAATSSAYLQAISRLERMRPGAAQDDDDDGDGDGLKPHGRQPSLFDPMEG